MDTHLSVQIRTFFRSFSFILSLFEFFNFNQKFNNGGILMLANQHSIKEKIVKAHRNF